jgi:type IV pilus assembly protein PilW
MIATPFIATTRQRGFTLIELMIAVALSLVIVAALAAMFVADSRARNELERANEQIENGRYASQTLADDLQLAGYMGALNVTGAVIAGLGVPASKPDPCDTNLGNLRTNMLMYLQGYDRDATDATTSNPGSLSCISDYKPGTDVLVIRRVSTCVRGTTDCPDVSGAPYYQASTCAPAIGGGELSDSNPSNWYALHTTVANLTLRSRSGNGTCNGSGSAPIRQFLTRIYYIAKNDRSGDGIPTLKRVDLGAGGAFGTPVALADGIENLQFEYGIDSNADGSPDAYTTNPDSYNPGGATSLASCNAPAAHTDNACIVEKWMNVMTIRAYLLARNTQVSTDYTDSKTYTLGLQADGTANNLTPGGTFKRHVFQTLVRLTNVASRREL